MKWLWLFAAAVGAAVLASAQADDASSADRLLEALTKGVPSADLLPRTAELEGETVRAVGLLEGPAGATCRARCGEAANALEELCTGLIRPEAARSEAVCYARVVELAGTCRARCPQ